MAHPAPSSLRAPSARRPEPSGRHIPVPIMDPCSFYGCGLDAVPGVSPYLCTRHAHLVICPTCSDWRILRRRWCPTCAGPGYCTPTRAQWALDTCARRREWERHPDQEDPKWGISTPPDFGPGSPVEAFEGGGR